MSEAKHTPGPWSLGADGEKITTNYRDKHGNMTDENWLNGGWAKHVAKVSYPSWMTGEEARANARLIAAAPELVQHLKDRCADLRAMLDSIGVQWDADERNCSEMEYAASMALIAKVEGRT